MTSNETINIPLEEYKRLIKIEGQYEELAKIYYGTLKPKDHIILRETKPWNFEKKIPEPTVTLLKDEKPPQKHTWGYNKGVR